jgi:hypothetical protein
MQRTVSVFRVIDPADMTYGSSGFIYISKEIANTVEEIALILPRYSSQLISNPLELLEVALDDWERLSIAGLVYLGSLKSHAIDSNLLASE